ncbi:MAG: M48 metallopeptidase family protein, partial [Chitinophagaceae bacterium]
MKNWKDKEEFKNRVLHFAGKIGVKPNRIALRQMKNKWASYSAKGYLTFNDELLDIEKDLGDYVIVHELLHFRAP